MMPRGLRRLGLAAVSRANSRGKLLAIRLARWTGKSREYVHPKHLLGDGEGQYWYLAHLTPGARLLDVGCGNAQHTLKAARRVGWAAGVDRSAASLGVGLRTSMARDVRNLALAVCDVEHGLPFRSGTFDVVLCLDLLEHVVRRTLVLGEIRRVLNAEGRLLLAVPNRATTWKRRLERAGLFAYSDPDHKIEYTLPELEAELKGGGFALLAVEPSVFDTPWIGLIDVVGGLSLGTYRWLTALRRRLAERHPDENAGFYAV